MPNLVNEKTDRQTHRLGFIYNIMISAFNYRELLKLFHLFISFEMQYLKKYRQPLVLHSTF